MEKRFKVVTEDGAVFVSGDKAAEDLPITTAAAVADWFTTGGTYGVLRVVPMDS